jgi:hypothetical protein
MLIVVAPAGALLQCLLCLPFAALGMVFVFGRGEIIFDKSTVTTWWGFLLLPLRTNSRELAAFNAASLSRETRIKFIGSKYNVFAIRIIGANGDKLNVCDELDELKARVMVEEIAKFTGLKLLDSTGGVLGVREAPMLGKSLREQVQNSTEELNINAPPPKMRSIFTVQGNQVAFKLPPPPFSRRVLATILGGTVTFLIIINKRAFPISTQGKWVLCLSLGLLELLIVLGAILRQAHQKITVSADPDHLCLTTKIFLLNKTEEIAGKDLAELRLENHAGQNNLAALSSKKILRFGYGLPREELEWIRQVLLKALTI